jgi:hypothetical protein
LGIFNVSAATTADFVPPARPPLKVRFDYFLNQKGAARGVVVIQSGMPAAVLTYLFAARYGNDPQEAASIVVISTIISIVALPLFLMAAMTIWRLRIQYRLSSL